MRIARRAAPPRARAIVPPRERSARSLGRPGMPLASAAAAGKLLRAAQQTVAVAESSAGGIIAARLLAVGPRGPRVAQRSLEGL
jgi:hypothetical protein